MIGEEVRIFKIQKTIKGYSYCKSLGTRLKKIGYNVRAFDEDKYIKLVARYQFDPFFKEDK